MKKKIFVFALLFIMIFSISAGYNPKVEHIAYIRPMSGTSGIPMNPSRDKGSNYRYGELREPLNDDVFVGDVHSKPGVPKQWQYGNGEVIAIGGITNMNSTVAKGSKYTITAQCDNGFYFVSQSNPSYKRPFILYVIPKSLQEYNAGTSLIPVRAQDKVYGPLGVLSESNYKFELSYPAVSMKFEPPFELSIWDLENYFESYTTWFDLVLCLPGDIKNDVLEWNGVKYPLTEAQDYSAVVTLTIEDHYTNSTVPGEIQSISIPFSGFYSTQRSDRDTTDTVSMYVHPYANAGNINMTNYDPQTIANLHIQQSSEKKTSTAAPFGIFLSSSNDPEIQGDQFLLERDNLTFGDIRTASNSVPFTATITRSALAPGFTATGSATQSYDGTTTYVNKTIKNGNLIFPSYKLFDSGHRHEPIMTHDFSGDVSITIDNNSGVLMEAGRYESEIYVHVVPVV